MPTLLQRIQRFIFRLPDWHFSVQESVMGYRSFEEMFEDYLSVLNSGLLEPRYYRSIGNSIRALTMNELKNAMIVYGRATRPKLDFLVIGRKTKYGESTTGFPHIDKAIRKNLGKISESEHRRGSIMHSRNWSFLMNDLFVLGGIANQKPFYLASLRTQRNLWNYTRKHITIFARELIALFAVGYELHQLSDGSEAMVPPCEGTRPMNLKTYQTLRDQFRDGDSVAYILHPQIRRFSFNPETLEFNPVLSSTHETMV